MKKYFVLAVTALMAFIACSKNNSDITNTLIYDGQTYRVDFQGVADNEGFYDSDIHFLDDSALEQAWGMMWARGKIGTYSLPVENPNDFSLTKNTYPDYDIEFKSGTAKSWLEGELVCLVVDGVLTDGKSFKLSVKTQIYE